jgi:hypothetical protein
MKKISENILFNVAMPENKMMESFAAAPAECLPWT